MKEYDMLFHAEPCKKVDVALTCAVNYDIMNLSNEFWF